MRSSSEEELMMKGYAPLHIWYLSRSGNDRTCAVNDVTQPCLTWATVWSKSSPGDAIIVRGGTYDDNANYTYGGRATPSHPDIVIAYPGEKAIFDHTSAAGYYGFTHGFATA